MFIPHSDADIAEMLRESESKRLKIYLKMFQKNSDILI